MVFAPSACMRFLPVLLALSACTAPFFEEDAEGVGGKADSATAALEGTPEGVGLLRMLNDESTTLEWLDEALDARAARNLIHHRDGADGTFGTYDDNLYDDVAEVDAVPRIGPATLEQLVELALWNDFVPGGDRLLGEYDGVPFTVNESEAVLAYANAAEPDAMREAEIPSRAVTSIVDARPIATIAVLADLYWVGPATLEHLKAAVEDHDNVCMSTADCTAGRRCTGIPSDEWLEYGVCRDTTFVPGEGDDCEADDGCSSGLSCSGTTVYDGHGFCRPEWMRTRVEHGGVGSISVASEPTSYPVVVFGQATVPEDIEVFLDVEHSDPSQLWIALSDPNGTLSILWDHESGEVPSSILALNGISRDDAVNGEWALLVQSDGGEGILRNFVLELSSRWD